mgnify:CR=1 FL=1
MRARSHRQRGDGLGAGVAVLSLVGHRFQADRLQPRIDIRIVLRRCLGDLGDDPAQHGPERALEALDLLRSRKVTGKVVVMMDEGAADLDSAAFQKLRDDLSHIPPNRGPGNVWRLLAPARIPG